MSERLIAVFTPFENLTDPRIARTRVHDLFELVVTALCATIAGSDGWAAMAIATGGEAHGEEVRRWELRNENIRKQMLPATGGVFDAAGDAAASMFGRAKDDAGRVAAFGSQYATPQELFAKNLREIQQMVSLGLDPAIARRAMMANAQGLTDSQGGRLNRFAPANEVGSRQEMMMRDNAKSQGKQEKKINELVDVQKRALGKLDKIAEGGGVRINLIEVSL